jgi:hypothetical protein
MLKRQTSTAEILITTREGDKLRQVVVTGDVSHLQDDPDKLYQLVDLLGLPKGSEIKIVAHTTSTITR